MIKYTAEIKENIEASAIEIQEELQEGEGVVIIRNAYSDFQLLDRAYTNFKNRIEIEEKLGISANDLTTPRSNKRLFNALNKFAEDNPKDFIEYYSNEYLHHVINSCLGPFYQIVSEINLVVPGELGQLPHRDYPFCVYTKKLLETLPLNLLKCAPFLTLQAGIIHQDTPIEMGSTRFILGSQKESDGYRTMRNVDDISRFEKEAIQFDLKKGDLIFFNPSIYHAGGGNRTINPRLVNLLQISSGMIRPLATINFLELIKNLYQYLILISDKAKVERICRVITECWPFPTNFITDKPKNDFHAGIMDKDWLLDLWTKKIDASIVELKYSQKLESRKYIKKTTNPEYIKKSNHLLQLIKDQSRIVIYPSGGVAKEFSKNQYFKYLNIVGFSDKNENLIGKKIENIEIFPINKILELKPKLIIIAVSNNKIENIKKHLENYNLHKIEKIII
jgi:ectoine hydroxylase-related dioxygenase (phytanoyl-CoA dioxygenase family)